MAGISRTLTVLTLFLVVLLVACSTNEAERSEQCVALNALGAELEAYGELMVWPGITVSSLLDGTDDLEAAVLVVENLSDTVEVQELTDAFATLRAAVASSFPASLAETRPQEPAQMAARFIGAELAPFEEAYQETVEELC